MCIFYKLFLLTFFTIASSPIRSIRIRPPSIANISSPNSSKSHIKTSILSSIINKLKNIIDRAKIEIYINDVNDLLNDNDKPERFFIVLEYSEAFSKSGGLNRTKDGKLIKITNSDKVSLPESVLSRLMDTNAHVPWQFVIQKVHRVTEFNGDVREVSLNTNEDYFTKEESHKERLSCSSLDFRAQEGFIFIPKWMMNNLSLKPYDVVCLTHIDLPEAIYVRIQPMEQDFFQLESPKAILEEYLRQYSTLTRGTTIPITHEDRTYNLLIVSINTQTHENVECASIQDADVAVDIVKQ